MTRAYWSYETNTNYTLVVMQTHVKLELGPVNEFAVVLAIRSNHGLY